MHWLANRDETQVSLEHVSDKCLDDKSAKRVVVRINGCHKNEFPPSCTLLSNWNVGLIRKATHVMSCQF